MFLFIQKFNQKLNIKQINEKLKIKLQSTGVLKLNMYKCNYLYAKLTQWDFMSDCVFLYLNISLDLRRIKWKLQ